MRDAYSSSISGVCGEAPVAFVFYAEARVCCYPLSLRMKWSVPSAT